MIDALIAGRLHGTPMRRVGKSGKPFVTAKLRVPARNGETVWINAVAFSDHVMTGLLALADGAGVALAGELTADTWTDKEGKARPGLNLVASELLSEFHVNRRRQAMQKKPGTPAEAEETRQLREWYGQRPAEGSR